MGFSVKSLPVALSLLVYASMSPLHAIDCSFLFSKSTLPNIADLAKEVSPFKRFDKFTRSQNSSLVTLSHYTHRPISSSDLFFPKIQIDLIQALGPKAIKNYLLSSNPKITEKYSLFALRIDRLSKKHPLFILANP